MLQIALQIVLNYFEPEKMFRKYLKARSNLHDIFTFHETVYKNLIDPMASLLITFKATEICLRYFQSGDLNDRKSSFSFQNSAIAQINPPTMARQGDFRVLQQ